MANKNNNLASSGPRRGAFWFALLSVASLQLSAAVHRFDHVAGYVDGACQICIQLDRAGDVAADHPVAATVASIRGDLTRTLPSAPSLRTEARDFDARAPPRL